MKKYEVWGWIWLIGLSLWLALPGRAAAQTPAPSLDFLLVEIWPEYDRPEVLIIYQGTLAETTPLPAQLTFPLPDYIEALHVVAIQQEGVLVEADPGSFALRREAGTTTLAMTLTTSRQFHFEYYDPVILNRQADLRTVNFQAFAPYPIQQTRLQVKEPAAASTFSLRPLPENSQFGQDGLRYSTLTLPPLSESGVFTVSASYRRSTDQVSTQIFDPPAAPPAGRVEFGEPATSVPTEVNLGYILIGTGVVLLVGAAGAWWWLSRKMRPAKVVQPHPKVRPGAARPSQPASSADPAGYCYRCGAPLRAEANYCHHCGAERRRD
jgi:hypothetical protein